MAVVAQAPDARTPLVGRLDADFLGQVHTLETWETARQLQRFLFGGVVTGQDAAILSALFAKDASQATGIDTSDGNSAVGLEIVRQGLLVTPDAGNQRQDANYQANGPEFQGLGIFRGRSG